MKPNVSAITTSQKEQPSQTGTQGGERGLATPASSGQAVRLAASSPRQVNNSLASLAQQCGVNMRVSKDMKAKYQDGAFIGYEPTGRTVATVSGTPEAIAAMRDRMEGAFAPPVEDQLEVWLAELDMIAPRRASSTNDDDLRMQAYINRLAGYPADVVREALLSRTWRFFPSWFELQEVCDELVAHRRAVRAELDRAEEKAREREMRARAIVREVTPEERQAAEDAHVAQKAEAARMVDDVLAGMKAKLAEDEAAQKARADAARASYAKFRPEADASVKPRMMPEVKA